MDKLQNQLKLRITSLQQTDKGQGHAIRRLNQNVDEHLNYVRIKKPSKDSLISKSFQSTLLVNTYVMIFAEEFSFTSIFKYT